MIIDFEDDSCSLRLMIEPYNANLLILSRVAEGRALNICSPLMVQEAVIVDEGLES